MMSYFSNPDLLYGRNEDGNVMLQSMVTYNSELKAGLWLCTVFRDLVGNFVIIVSTPASLLNTTK